MVEEKVNMMTERMDILAEGFGGLTHTLEMNIRLQLREQRIKIETLEGEILLIIEILTKVKKQLANKTKKNSQK